MNVENKKILPDVAMSQKSGKDYPLERVGMSNVEVPVRVKLAGVQQLLLAKMNIWVDLIDGKAKGIHMSRLYLLMVKWFEENDFSPDKMDELLTTAIEGQKGISESSHLDITFKLPLKKKSLLSENYGYRYYPIKYSFVKSNVGKADLSTAIELKLTYSSTCPCSAALSRQLLQSKIQQDFSSSEMIVKNDLMEWLGRDNHHGGTPHAQRSVADIKVKVDAQGKFRKIDYLSDFLIQLEKVIRTPVQTAVKREDEQEFARLNAENLIFCEDAARMFKHYLEEQTLVEDYRVGISHLESLHAHDAVAVTIKGVDGGLTI